jgi:hypothetical protein
MRAMCLPGVVIATALCLTVFVASCTATKASTTSPAVAAAQVSQAAQPASDESATSQLPAAVVSPEQLGLPSRMTTLRDLNIIYDRPDLSAEQRTGVLLHWLAAECASPRETEKGLGGGDVTSGYVQAQLALMLREKGDPRLLAGLLGKSQLPAGPVRDCVVIALAMAGDGNHIADVRGIATGSSEGYHRVLALEALGYLGEEAARPVLEAARSDAFVVSAAGPRGTIGPSYPVREAAEGGLRMLADPSNLKAAKALRAEFARTVGDVRDTPGN